MEKILEKLKAQNIEKVLNEKALYFRIFGLNFYLSEYSVNM
jgi:hypothetical protein